MFVRESSLRAARGLAWELGAVTNKESLPGRTLQRLLEMFHGDCVGLNSISPTTGEAGVVMEPDLMTAVLEVAFASHVGDHPLVLHYTRTPSDLSPVRISDLVADRRWRQTGVYADIFRPIGTDRQLALMVDTGSPAGIVGYAVNRNGRDFTADELALAAVLQPVLMSIYRSAQRHELPTRAVAALGHVRALTSREIEILELVATGAGAQAVAHTLAITPATVRKHLENAYRKLDATNRLTAINRARALGLIPPGVDTPRERTQ
jgi:DNA-binding CsgD family transcriptional regulator